MTKRNSTNKIVRTSWSVFTESLADNFSPIMELWEQRDLFFLFSPARKSIISDRTWWDFGTWEGHGGFCKKKERWQEACQSATYTRVNISVFVRLPLSALLSLSFSLQLSVSPSLSLRPSFHETLENLCWRYAWHSKLRRHQRCLQNFFAHQNFTIISNIREK